jgi:hypothetical protein
MNTTKIAAAVLLTFAAAAAHAAPSVRGGSGGVPYQDSIDTEFNLWNNYRAYEAFAPVPSGKQLIIENVSYRTWLPEGQTVSCSINEASGTELYLPTPQPSLPWAGRMESNANVQTTFVLGEGDYYVYCNRSDSTGFGELLITVTGTLINAD